MSLITNSSFAQTIKQYSIAATSEAVGLPFTNYSPYHPGAEFTTALKINEKEKSTRYIGLKAGFFYHRKLETALYLGGEYQYSFMMLNNKLSLDIPMGLGYLHSFYPSELYEQNSNGDFEKVSQFGRPHLYINLGLGLTYRMNERVQPFVRQSLLLETPFANGIPVIPHSLIHLGIQIKIQKNEE